jgi:dihydrofolate reductase
MKYRILVRIVNVNVQSLNWYIGPSGTVPWETEQEEEALKQYKNLLESNSAGNLTLVQMAPVNIEVSKES